MPYLTMKSKISKDSLREKRVVLGVCKKPNTITKKTSPDPNVFGRIEHLPTATHTCDENDQQHTCLDTSTRDVETNEPKDLLVEDSSQSQEMEIASNYMSNMDSIFSPVLDDELYAETEIDQSWGAYASSSNKITLDNQSCNFSDFLISDVLIASLPFTENDVNGFAELSPLPCYIFPEQYMLLPYLEDGSASSNEVKSDEESITSVDNHDLSFDWSKSHNLETESEQTEEFDPQLFIRNQPELSDVVSSYCPDMRRKRKAVTLVLDLDETLVHSTLEASEGTDFSFRVFFNMQENTVYVKQRPHLHHFLERVVELFHVVIFTASQSIYASQLLDILDPDGKFISERFYRDSCILSDGIYTKDLTVLGLDLAKVAIVDNCPQVYRLQINNGIPITSWYDDPNDDGLISLLPLLETLADADDVRPIIANKFGNEQ